MTLKEIDELVESTKNYKLKDMQDIAWGLPIFDSCNYILQMEKKYHIIYADPPWSYNDTQKSGGTAFFGASVRYDTMNNADIAKLPISELADKLASLNRSWQSKEGTFRALGMAGIEPTPSKSHVTGPRFRINHWLRRLISHQFKQT